jgi:hypothetical protein
MEYINKIKPTAFIIIIGSFVLAFGQYKNVAFNPADVRAAGMGYPHATSNSEYPCPPASGTGACTPDTTFLALNAIDGRTNNNCHGSLPNCGSWGPQVLSNLWWRVDFGHDVQVDKVVIWIRHDFPHDSYWKDAMLVFSDSSKVPIHPDSAALPQSFLFTSRLTKTLTITNLVPLENKWCAFAEVQVWGYDPPTSISNPTRSPITSGKDKGGIFCYLPGVYSLFPALPAHAAGAELYTVQGKKIFTFNRGKNGNHENISVPADLSRGIYRIKYF